MERAIFNIERVMRKRWIIWQGVIT
jgi:hypothetical protein